MAGDSIYKVIDKEDIVFFEETIGEEYILKKDEQLLEYSKDYTEDLLFMPELVLLPKNSLEISKILTYCNSKKIPVTPRGAGTGLAGAALPVYGGIVLATSRLNKILNIDLNNFQMTTEPGVINQLLKDELAKYNLAYPPDPASKGSCFIGGNIAHSSGGPQALKYGTTKDYVLNLEVVLPTGEILWTGANTLKNSTGYNLTQLFIGSEGTLGVVTKIVLKIVPLVSHQSLLIAAFDNITDACAAVSPLFLAGLQPLAVELLDKTGVKMVCEYKKISNPFPAGNYFLMLAYEGSDIHDFEKIADKTYEVCIAHNLKDMLLADTTDMQNTFWNIRRSIGEVAKLVSIYKEEDTIVPRSALPELVEEVERLALIYGFRTVCYGHAGDGNLHINILKDNMTDQKWDIELPKAITKIFEKCKELGGTISGEHGIGWVQKPYMSIVLNDTHFRLLRGIKNVFDPNGIMNPGKIFDAK